jgi:hypothetical protein
LPTDNKGKNDPFGVCKNGPQTKSDTLEPPASSNPCEEFMKKYNMDQNASLVRFSPFYFGLTTYKGGPVICRFQGTPC